MKLWCVYVFLLVCFCYFSMAGAPYLQRPSMTGDSRWQPYMLYPLSNLFRDQLHSTSDVPVPFGTLAGSV